jgi:hypothetical protein
MLANSPLHSMFTIRYSFGEIDFLQLWLEYLIKAPAELRSTSIRLKQKNSRIIGHYVGPMNDVKSFLHKIGALTLPSFQSVEYGACDGLTVRTFECCGDFTCSNPSLLNQITTEFTSKKNFGKKSEFVYNSFSAPILQQIVDKLRISPKLDTYILFSLSTNKNLSSRNIQYSLPEKISDYSTDYFIWLQSTKELLQTNKSESVGIKLKSQTLNKSPNNILSKLEGKSSYQAQISGFQTLTDCLGARLSKYMITPSSSFRPNDPLYSYSWLSNGDYYTCTYIYIYY